MMSFEELGLKEELLQAVKELGFEKPMPIQNEVIPYLLGGGGDVIALAQTGTGKTAAFGLPLLQALEPGSGDVQALVLSPTRELCIQIADDLKDYSSHLKGARVLPVYGGASMKNQIQSLNKGADVIVATPGRLLDLCNRGLVDLSTVKTVVMDEADEMLNMGFLEDIDTILSKVPEDRKTMLFSATMPDEIDRLSRKYMHEPHEIVVGRKNEGSSNVRHICLAVHSKDKYRTLKRIVDYYPRIYGIIFCRTKMETKDVSDRLIKDGYNVDALHGDLSQVQRDYVMQRFRLHNIQLLVATDVAARGIDVDDLTHIINYTLPDEDEVYTHRSGRTGRAGKTGISIAIVNMKEQARIRRIERAIGKTFETGRIPTGKEICSKQVFSLIDQIEKAEVNEEEIEGILPSVVSRLAWLDKEELLKRMVSLEFSRLLKYYQDDDDFDAAQSGGRKRIEVQVVPGYTKLFINLGKMDGFGPKNLFGMLHGCVGDKVDIGQIDIFTRYSLFDVLEEQAATVASELCTLKMRGRAIKVQVATEEQINRGRKDNKKKRRE